MLNKKPTREQLLYQRYVLVGIGIGLYLGIFFRPVREPSFMAAFILSLLATAATMLVRAIQKKPLFSLKRLVIIYLLYTFMILAFEARHIAFDLAVRWGVAGRWGASILGVVVGGLGGYAYGWHTMNKTPEKGADKS